AAFDAHLPLDLGPPEDESGAGVGLQLPGLPAFEVGEEGEAAGIDPLQEHDPRGGTAVRGGRGERHRVGLAGAGGDGLDEPRLELDEGIGMRGVLGESGAGVVRPEGGDVYGVGHGGGGGAPQYRTGSSRRQSASPAVAGCPAAPSPAACAPGPVATKWRVASATGGGAAGASGGRDGSPSSSSRRSRSCPFEN